LYLQSSRCVMSDSVSESDTSSVDAEGTGESSTSLPIVAAAEGTGEKLTTSAAFASVGDYDDDTDEYETGNEEETDSEGGSATSDDDDDDDDNGDDGGDNGVKDESDDSDTDSGKITDIADQDHYISVTS